MAARKDMGSAKSRAKRAASAAVHMNEGHAQALGTDTLPIPVEAARPEAAAETEIQPLVIPDGVPADKKRRAVRRRIVLDRETVSEARTRIAKRKERREKRKATLKRRSAAAAWAVADKATAAPSGRSATKPGADAAVDESRDAINAENAVNEGIGKARQGAESVNKAKVSYERARKMLREKSGHTKPRIRSRYHRPSSRRRVRLAPQKGRIVLRMRVPAPIMKVREAAAAAGTVASVKLAPAARLAAGVKRLGSALLVAAMLLPLAGLLALPLLITPTAVRTASSAMSMDGLPEWITLDLVLEALRCQEEYGHPAGATIAQMIAESGADDPSMLATRDHNLFGMYWDPSFADCPEVAGSATWRTQEDYGDGLVDATATFTVFNSDVDCIRFRSRVFLQSGFYRNNPLLQEAIEKRSSVIFCEGIGGWATGRYYVEYLLLLLDEYDLLRFDSMTEAQLLAAVGNLQAATPNPTPVVDGNISGGQAAVIRCANSAVTPSPGAGYCAAWVTDVFINAGIGTFWGNACDMYWAYCHSSSLSELRPGMIIAVYTEPYSPAAIEYGHVGIYVGNGLVAQNVSGEVGYQALDEWIAVFGVSCEVRWGWLGNVPLA